MCKNILKKKKFHLMLYCKCKSKFRLSQLYLFIYTVYCDFYFNFCLSVSKVVSVNNIYIKKKVLGFLRSICNNYFPLTNVNNL